MSAEEETDIRPGGDNEGDRSASMRLRAERPRVTRLSRKVLAGAAAVGAAAIFGGTFWALQNNRSHTNAPSELYTTDHHNVADGLEGLPRDYAGVPRQVPQLGPPLSGDLGRPIVNAQNAPSAGVPACRFGAATSRPGNRSGPFEPIVRIDQYSGGSILDCTSCLGWRLDDRTQPDEPARAARTRRCLCAERSGPQARFRQRVSDRRTTSPDRVATPASTYVVQAGNIIPAALITGIRSDLPGQIMAQVTQSDRAFPSRTAGDPTDRHL